MGMRIVARGLVTALAFAAVAAAGGDDPPGRPTTTGTPWRGVHLMAPGHDGVPLLKRAIAEGLAPLKVNALVLEVNYNFQFRSHPDLANPRGLSHEGVTSD
jgi:hypothetical protein